MQNERMQRGADNRSATTMHKAQLQPAAAAAAVNHAQSATGKLIRTSSSLGITAARTEQ